MMKPKRKLGDKINRGFCGLVIILGMAFIIRGAIGVVNYHPPYTAYPETQDDFAETANGLGIDTSLVDSTVNDAYVDKFFRK